MVAYYNELNPFAAAWLRELIKAGLIAPGEVDERDIRDVQPDDLRGYAQCHFFAGIGAWSYALRCAGWPDNRPLWTGSCPCPSFSAAGKGEGFDDPRHLWPAWFELIRECRPATIFGEQVSAAIGYGWLDLIQTDLEAAAYAVGKAVLGAASVGAPHGRQRLYFVADTMRAGRQQERGSASCDEAADGRAGRNGGEPDGHHEPSGDSETFRSPHPERDGGRSDESGWEAQGRGADGRDCTTGDGPDTADTKRWPNAEISAGRQQAPGRPRNDCETGDGANSDGGRPGAEGLQRSGQHGLFTPDSGTGLIGDPALSGSGTLNRESLPGDGQEVPVGGSSVSGHLCDSPQRRAIAEPSQAPLRNWRGPGWLDPLTARSVAAAGATRGFWRDCDWWYGRDGKYRPIEPGLFPLAHGASKRVGRLRGYGNAIVAPVAEAFIRAYIEARTTGPE